MYENLICSYASGSGIFYSFSSSSETFVSNCQFKNNVGAGFGGATNRKVSLLNCESNGNGGIGIHGGGASSLDSKIIGCYIHANANDGAQMAGGSYSFNSIFESNSLSGFDVGNNSHTFLNCIFSKNISASGDGFSCNFDGYDLDFFINCVFYQNGRYGINRISLTRYPIYTDYNCFYGNGTSAINNDNNFANTHSITTSPNFQAASTSVIALSDFSLMSASPCIGAGILNQQWASDVGLYPSSNYRSNIGVDQGEHASTGSASAN
jgi:hypothetical protein